VPPGGDVTGIGGGAALLGRPIGTARRQCEGIWLADCRHACDAHRDVEVASHPSHDKQLLVVLFAEIGDVRKGLDQPLCNHRRDAVEVTRARCAAQTLAQPGYLDDRRKIGPGRFH
jgi:hypothetical protein